VWQCGTIQVDFSMPERLDADLRRTSTAAATTPVMLHRAILGSMERFIGILIEEYAGIFPLWLAPLQVVVMGITDAHAEYAAGIVESLKKQGFRATADLRNEKIGLKIREHTLQRVPYLLVVGDREVKDQRVAVRTRSGEDLGSMALEDFRLRLDQEIASHGNRHLED
jgi:threonyl-tRNA synthetase